MRILGISCHYHEAAAALLVDGRVVAACAEERISRRKHDARFPTGAIGFCLAQGGITASDLDWVVFYEKPFIKFQRHLDTVIRFFPGSLGYFVESMRNALTEKLWIRSIITDQLGVTPDKVLFVPHHLSHAAAAFYPSPFPRAAFLTLDGVGDRSTGSWGVARGHKLIPMGELQFPHSVGLLYSTFTAFLGFEVNEGEYKVMGMAGYGKPRHTSKVRKTFRQLNDGSIELNLNYFSFHTTATRMYSDAFIEEFRGLDRFDLAASLQKVTEDVVFGMMTAIAKKTGESRLCFGGGVALNSVINGNIPRRTPFKDVFAFPAAGDDGGAVGAALYAYHHVLGQKKRVPLEHVFWGASSSNADIAAFLKRAKIKARRLSDTKIIKLVVEALLAGQVVGWFEGRAEFGPRALGHRSIIADPKDAAMKDLVNRKIKFREEFRPFAPVVLDHLAKDYYRVTTSRMAPYMLATFDTTAKGRRIAAATTHVDGTSRIQTVDSRYKGRYGRLLRAFYRKTGRPILLNTSFNLKGEPIVNSPADAYSTFMRSGIDLLVLENFVIVKQV